ncbi:MAG: hypothetical protein R3E53_13550 [Myxococcota bacterium]
MRGLEARAEALAARIEQERRALDEGCAALSGFVGGPDRLAALPRPSDATIERFERDFAGLDAEGRELGERRRAADEELETIDRELESDGSGRDLPGPEDLRGARARREELWKGVAEAWLEGGREEGAAAIALAAAYAGSVAEADGIGDRLFDEHERVARRTQLVRRRVRFRERRAALDGEAERLAGRLEALQGAWREAWRESGVVPATPREMEAWTRRHAELAARLDACRALEAERREAVRRVEEQGAAVRGALVALEGHAADGSAEAPASERLSALLARADERLAVVAREEAQRARLAGDLERARREATRARAEYAQAEEARAAWRARWDEAIEPLEIGSEALPAEAEAVLDRIERVQARSVELAGFRERVRHIERDALAFATALDTTVEQAGVGLPPGDPSRRTLALVEGLRAGLADRTRREALRARRSEIEAERQEVVREREAAGEALARLVATAGVDAAALDDAEQRSAARRVLDARLAGVEALAPGGACPRRALGGVADLDAGRLESELAELDRALELEEREREEANARLLELERDLRDLDGRDEAARASREAEGGPRAHRPADAGLRREACCRASAASGDRPLRGREPGPDPDPLERHLLAHHPRTLCGGRRWLLESDEPVLLCERATGEQVGVEGLSEGTRDQLFLALRLAALEHHARQAEPMPLVVDDILLTFDDPRARVTLGLMGELARDYQVLFFTHHARLAELAREAIPAERLRVHELDRA